MFRTILLVVMMGLSSVQLAFATDPEYVAVLQKDDKGSADSVLTGRYEGSTIVAQTQKAFDEITIANGPAVGEEYDSEKKFSSTVTVQGRVTRTLYLAPEGRSSLEVFGNYVDALKDKGFAPVFECAKEACGPSFKVLTYSWKSKALMVKSTSVEQLRGLLSEAMFDSVIDPRFSLLKKGDAGAATYVAVFAAQNQG